MGNGIILCVDDERVVLNGLQSQLIRDFGTSYTIEMAESGEEALELVTNWIDSGNDIPIVIADQLMPGIKGHELLKKIHQVSPETYTVLLTGYTDLEAVTEAVNHANLYRYISKPWEGNDLLLTVREAIKGFYQDRQLEEQNKLLERHNKELEKLVEERTGELMREKMESDKLLKNILPEETAAELKEKGEATPHSYKMVSVLFTDFLSFTKAASEISPQELIQTLNECFSAFDNITEKNNLEKIKTIGDAYMCAGGLPVKNTTNAIDAVNAALEIIDWLENWNNERFEKGLKKWEIRIGIHTGELIAGVVGTKKFAYDLWGDAVNVASRMESCGEKGKVNISPITYELIKDHFDCEYRGKQIAKGKGEMDMYFVNAKRSSSLNNLERIDFNNTKQFILEKLKTELPKNLYYHGIHHTIKVYNIALELIKHEALSDYDALLLKTAVLFHDSGLILQSDEHEQIGCRYAKEILPKFGYTGEEIEKICGIIMATRIPQSPKTKLEEIICDADLDYLGRNDFEELSENLFKELNHLKPMSREQWIKMEIQFLEEHQYFTEYSKKLRGEKKKEHLKLLKESLTNKNV